MGNSAFDAGAGVDNVGCPKDKQDARLIGEGGAAYEGRYNENQHRTSGAA
jgi:hypothetical protein